VAREIINAFNLYRKWLVHISTMGENRVHDGIGLVSVFMSKMAVMGKSLQRPRDKHEVMQVDGEIPRRKRVCIVVEEERAVQNATVYFDCSNWTCGFEYPRGSCGCELGVSH
jgi:hypothetical protein